MNSLAGILGSARSGDVSLAGSKQPHCWDVTEEGGCVSVGGGAEEQNNNNKNKKKQCTDLKKKKSNARISKPCLRCRGNPAGPWVDLSCAVP